MVKQNCSSSKDEQSCTLHDVQILKEEKQVALKVNLSRRKVLFFLPNKKIERVGGLLGEKGTINVL